MPKQYLDKYGNPIQQEPAAVAPDGIVADKEPGTWGGGFLKGILGNKALMTTAGTAAAAAAPFTGGLSLPALAAVMGAGGAAGAVGSNLVRRATDSRPQDDLSSEAVWGGAEGAFSALTGPMVNGAGRVAGRIGKAIGPWGRRGLGFASGGVPGAAAVEAALNPELGPKVFQSVGDAASIPTIKRTVSELGRNAKSLFDEAPASMQSLQDAHGVRSAMLRRGAGIRQGREVPYRAGGGVSDRFADAPMPNMSPAVKPLTPAEPVFSDVRGQLDDVAGLDDELELVREMIGKGYKPATAQRIVSPAMRSLQK